MTSSRTRIAALLLGLAWATPTSFAADRAGKPTPQQAIERLLECDDCKDGEQQAVVRLGAASVAALGQVLREGPSPQRRERARRELQAAYRQLQDYEKRNPRVRVGLTEDEYIRIYSENLAARHAIRAATALAAIGSPAARKELQEALAGQLRPDVQQVVRKALGGKAAR
jgi:hypothetical protein